MPINPDDWLKEAIENQKLASDLLKKSPRWSYFMTYSAAELCLKAVLISLGNPAFTSYKHDLIKIWKAGLNKSSCFKEEDIKLFGLEMYSNLRYPDKRGKEVTQQEAKEAIEAAERILKTSQELCPSITKNIDNIMKWERIQSLKPKTK